MKTWLALTACAGLGTVGYYSLSPAGSQPVAAKVPPPRVATAAGSDQAEPPKVREFVALQPGFVLIQSRPVWVRIPPGFTLVNPDGTQQIPPADYQCGWDSARGHWAVEGPGVALFVREFPIPPLRYELTVHCKGRPTTSLAGWCESFFVNPDGTWNSRIFPTTNPVLVWQ